MHILYHAGGAQDFDRLSQSYTGKALKSLIFNAQRVLLSRGYKEAAKILSTIDFEIWEATNGFSDTFSMLYTIGPLEVYESLRGGQFGTKEDFTVIAKTFDDLGVFIRFIVCDLEMADIPEATSPPSISKVEVFKLVNGYIGVSGGYLGDFSYRTHEEFYPQYCDLDINPYSIQGTTRERFIHILQNGDNLTQAKIIRGILKKYPVGSKESRTQEQFDYFEAISRRLEENTVVSNPTLLNTTEVLRRTLDDAETLLRKSGAVSAIDRVHTALHGYLIAACDRSGISYEADAGITRLYKLLREQHPVLSQLSSGSDEINKMLMACAVIVDAFNPVRNRLTLAHPNKVLLGDDEAMLVVNIARTLLHYLNKKFQ